MIGRSCIPCAAILLASAAPVPALPDLDGTEPQVRVAIREAHDELRSRPDSAAAWGHYGSVLDVHAFTVEAGRAYEVAADLDPDDFRWPYLMAVLVSADDPGASLAHLQRALDRNEAYTPLHLRHGAMMEAMGRADAAIASYERAVALEDDNPYAHAGLGRCMLARGDAQEAKVHLDRAIALDVGCRPALSALAAYARRNGDMTAAQRWSHRASEAPDPTPRDQVLADKRRLGVSTTEIIRRANEMQEAGRADAARQTLQWLVRQNPASVRGRNRLGEFYLAADDAGGAAEQFRAALAVEPDFVPARLGLAHVLTRAGRHEEGQREYETVLATHPSSAPAHRGLAISLAAEGRMAPAAEHFARVIELAPDDRRARLACGSALLGAGLYQRAADVLAPLMTGDDGSDEDLARQAREAIAGAACGLAELHASAGAFAETAAQLARATALLDDTADRRGELAMRYARSASLFGQRGDWAAAIELLRRGLAAFPQSARICNELAWLLATAPDPALRNGDQAVELAERAVELTAGEGCNELDTLAAAYEEAGRFDEAIATAERALAIAQRAAPSDLADQIAERLRRLRETPR